MCVDVWFGKSARSRLEEEGDNHARLLKQMSASNGPFNIFEHVSLGMPAFVGKKLPVVTSQLINYPGIALETKWALNVPNYYPIREYSVATS